MSTALVNGRVDVQLKKQAEEVLQDNHTTPSEAIRQLYQYLANKRQLPDYMAENAANAERADRERRLAILESVAGISHDPDLATDDRTAAVLYEELMRLHA